MKNTHWTKEETVLALALYCKIPFGKINKFHPQVIELSRLIGRTPAAVSMKMGNFGRFDPELSARGVAGLSHGSHLDKEVWDEYYQNMEELFERTSAFTGASEVIISDEELQLPVGETRTTLSKSRKGQAFFRSTVLSAFVALLESRFLRCYRLVILNLGRIVIQLLNAQIQSTGCLLISSIMQRLMRESLR